MLLVLHTEIKVERNMAGEWQFRLHKKAMRDSTLGRLLGQLLAFYTKPTPAMTTGHACCTQLDLHLHQTSRSVQEVCYRGYLGVRFHLVAQVTKPTDPAGRV